MECTKVHLAAVERRLRMYDKMIDLLNNGGTVEQAKAVFYKCDICKSHGANRNCPACCISDAGGYESCNARPYYSSVVYLDSANKFDTTGVFFYTSDHVYGKSVQIVGVLALLNALQKRRHELSVLIDINGFCVRDGKILKKRKPRNA